jgi:hypothetical protein
LKSRGTIQKRKEKMSKNMLSYFTKLPKQAELLKNDEILELKKTLE